MNVNEGEDQPIVKIHFELFELEKELPGRV